MMPRDMGEQDQDLRTETIPSPDTGIFSDCCWQMSFGERAALEGILTQLKPALSLEIGTAEGGSLERIAAHSGEVHSFDLVPPQLSDAEAGHVNLHTGDSHELLPVVLARFADEQRNVDFVLIDGDHSAEGVRRDVEDLLNSSAIGNTAMLVHDTTNEMVRAGLDAIHYAAWPKVAHVNLDFVPGYIFSEERLRHELWGGLGVIIVDSSRLAYTAGPVVQERYYPAAQLFAKARDQLVGKRTVAEPRELQPPTGTESLEPKLVSQIGELEHEILRLTSVSAHHEALWRGIMNSASWRITTPLRFVAARARRLRRG
jgi:hypothetical protein